VRYEGVETDGIRKEGNTFPVSLFLMFSHHEDSSHGGEVPSSLFPFGRMVNAEKSTSLLGKK
jgi:hypothetical protein